MFYVTRKYRNGITGFSIWNIRHIISCNVIGWESPSCILLASHAWLGPGQSSSLAVNHQGFMKCVSLPFVHPLLQYASLIPASSTRYGSRPGGHPPCLPQAPQLKGQNCVAVSAKYSSYKKFYFIFYFLWWSLYFIKIQRNVVFPWHSATATFSNSEWANKKVKTEHECKHADVRLW